MIRVILAGCVDAKALPRPPDGPPWPSGYVKPGQPLHPRLPARDLYVSPLFRKRRAYAEREVAEGRAQAWAILSALFHCVPPERELPFYDWTMQRWRKDELNHWAQQVGISLLRLLHHADTDGGVVEIHAGQAYVEPARPVLEQMLGVTVETPLAGLQIGEQLAWYNRELDPQLTIAA